jgi:antitoxin (DNA-binding transcriptional repressor) of toxin-antitoxin stability system
LPYPKTRFRMRKNHSTLERTRALARFLRRSTSSKRAHAWSVSTSCPVLRVQQHGSSPFGPGNSWHNVAPALLLRGMQQIGSMCTSNTEAAEVHTECTMASFAIDTDVRLGTEKPLVAFPCLGISGSHSPLLFLLDKGAEMIVASTMVPVSRIVPLSSCFSSRRRRRRIVVSSGAAARPRSTPDRKTADLWSPSSAPGSERSCRKIQCAN